MILIALGANLPSPAGAPAATLSGALGRLKECGITILSVSSFYQTPAWPDPQEPPFVNAVASIATRLPPAERDTAMRWLLIGVSRDIEYDLRNDVFEKLETLPVSFYRTSRTGDLMSRATNDLSNVRMLVGPGIMYVVCGEEHVHRCPRDSLAALPG